MVTSLGQIAHPEEHRFLKMWRTNVDPAMRLLQDHRHVNFEIAMVTAGEGVYHTVSGLHPIEKGDVFVFPSNEPHWILEIRSGGLEIINLHFSQNFFREACTISLLYPNLFFGHSASFNGRIPAAKAGQLRELMEAVRQELEGEAPEHAAFIHSYLNMFFALLVREYGYYCPEDGIHAAAARIQPSLRFIDAHFAEDITLEQISGESGLSPYYFTRVFRECFHLKLWDYVLSKRIDAAKRMLHGDGAMTVLEIACRCGFHNTANFNRAFLRFTGLTPSEYRKGVPLH